MDRIGAEFYTLLQCLVALVLGGVIGWERELAGKWAGLRTQMLICLGATLFIKAGEFLILGLQDTIRPSALHADPTNIVQAIMTGIAFIGAGTVFRDRHGHEAHGLTTAATMLTVAPIGIAVASERYILAVGATALVFCVLRFVRILEC